MCSSFFLCFHIKNPFRCQSTAQGARAAAAVGDDHIQRATRGVVVPDSFTHGTSDQRRRWFLKGYQTGDFNQGDTFNAGEL
ncbi:MAG: hypothetical protein A2Y56_10780 [Candidatus Aminicenantes bacterium RBG_13_63_10]|nr:MAG: hypothetical protein A2Y56_10780 [Candidatus Aminicenantes bacterium RBG_13_63_10]